MVLKLVSENTSPDGMSPTHVVYKRSRWSPRAALEAGVVTALMVGIASYVQATYENRGLDSSPETNMTLMIICAALTVALGFFIYSLSKEQNFISEICKKYGYSLENLAASIPDMNTDDSGKSRMLLPMSPNMPANVDIYVRRNNEGIFVEEIHH